MVAKAVGRIPGALLPSERRNLQHLIANSPLNQAGLAVRLHSNEGYVSNLVKGKAGATLARWREICSWLDVPLTALFDPTPPPRAPVDPVMLTREIEERSRQLRELLESARPPAAGDLSPEMEIRAAQALEGIQGAIPPARRRLRRPGKPDSGHAG